MRETKQLIMGKNCILELLRFSPDRIMQVYSSQKGIGDAFYAELLKRKIPIKQLSKEEMNSMVQSESHQGYIALVRERKYVNIKEFLSSLEEKQKSIVLMLDSIFDPQNLGSIMRAGECFGVDLVVYSKNRGSDITPVVTKASAGASELLPLAKVSNLVETTKLFKEAGFWAVAAEAREGSSSLYDFDFPEKTLLVLGSEGEGIHALLSKNCDFHLAIPMKGRIDSLNVSQATAVLLSHFFKKP